MKVFMAGHTRNGLFNPFPSDLVVKSQHLATRLSVLSQIPLAILARVLADRGATKKMSAHFLS